MPQWIGAHSLLKRVVGNLPYMTDERSVWRYFLSSCFNFFWLKISYHVTTKLLYPGFESENCPVHFIRCSHVRNCALISSLSDCCWDIRLHMKPAIMNFLFEDPVPYCFMFVVQTVEISRSTANQITVQHCWARTGIMFVSLTARSYAASFCLILD